jgi:hypothetical protein
VIDNLLREILRRYARGGFGPMDHREPRSLTRSIRQLVVQPEQSSALHDANQHQEERHRDKGKFNHPLARPASVI